MKLKYDEPPSKFAFNFNLRRYIMAYLQAKDPSIQIGYLPFKGRNRVLYRVV